MYKNNSVLLDLIYRQCFFSNLYFLRKFRAFKTQLLLYETVNKQKIISENEN